MRLIHASGVLCLCSLLLSSPNVQAQLKDTLPQSRSAGDTILRRGRADSLQEVRILGQRPLIEHKVDRTVVHVDALMANAGGQAWSVLENTPGVTVDEDGTISLNGKSGVTILLDDRPTYLEGEALMNFLKALPSSQLEQVELLPTPPARYPAAGNAGIIILRTKKNRASGTQVELSSNFRMGVYPKLSQTIQVNGQYGAWQPTLMISYDYTRGFFNSYRYRDYASPVSSVTQDYNEESWAQSINYQASLEHKVGETSWGFLFGGDVNPYHEIGNYQDAYFSGAGHMDSSSLTHSAFHNMPATFYANAHVVRTSRHKRRTVSADADFDQYHEGNHQDEVTNDSSQVLPYELQDFQTFLAKIYGLKTDYTDKYGKHIEIEAGLEGTESVRQNDGVYLDGNEGSITLDPSLDNQFHYNEQIGSAYLTLRRTGDHLTFQGGLRMEHTDGKGQSTGSLDSSFHLHYTNLFPSVHVLWNPGKNDRHQVTFSYGRRVERPGYGDLNPTRFFFDRNTYFSGNPALQPDFSQNLEVAYTYLSRFTLGASYSSERDAIDEFFMTQGTDFSYHDVNMDHVVTTGLTADLTTPLSAHWTVNAHVEWMYKHYHSILPDTTILDRTLPNIQFSGNTRYTLGRGWSAEVGGFYRSEVLIAQQVLRPGGRLNLGLRKKVLKGKGNLTLFGNDVLRNWTPEKYIYMPGVVAHFRNTFDRREVSLTFTYSFGKQVEKSEHTTGAESERSRL